MTSGRVARKRALARERLIAAALELIAEGGVDGIRLRELTERADISFGAFYTHFASKEELLEAVVAESLGSMTGAILAYANEFEDAADTVAVAHRSFVKVAIEDPNLAWLIVHLEHADTLLQTASVPYLGPVLERGIAAGRFKPIDTDLAVRFLVGATIAVMRGILDGHLGRDADEESARLFLRACGLEDTEAAAVARRAGRH